MGKYDRISRALADGYPYRIIGNDGYEAVLVEIQPLLGHDYCAVYRYPGGDCCHGLDEIKRCFAVVQQTPEDSSKPEVHFRSTGQSGNIFWILGAVRQAMQKRRQITAYNELWDRVQQSHSYRDALSVIREYVNLVDDDGRWKEESPGYVCRVCGERYTAADLNELREMGEAYHRDKGCFFCPDCWDDFQRLPLERQAEILIDND